MYMKQRKIPTAYTRTLAAFPTTSIAVIIIIYYVARPVSGQDESNPT